MSSAAAAARIKEKTESGAYDVFLCHNSADKPEVKKIAAELRKRGVRPWLDVDELRPGQAWQLALEEQIGNIKAAAVCVGSHGMGLWQEQEVLAFVNEFVTRKCPVIPVLLPTAPAEPKLPIFLRQLTWVDFRRADPDPVHHLIWGVTGEQPLEPDSDEGLNGKQDSDLRSVLRQASIDFQLCCQKIRELDTLKGFHDELHRLHFKCCQPLEVIVDQAEDFPDDDIDLSDCEFHLSDTIERLHKISAQASEAAVDIRWLDHLQRARDDLRKSISDRDMPRLRRAFRCAKSVVGRHMSEINTLLKQAAESLSDFPALRSLRLFGGKLTTMDVEPQTLSRLKAGLASLEQLMGRLNYLVKEHDDWQTFDSELRVIEDTLGHDIRELSAWWPDLKGKCERLYKGREASWAQKLGEMGDALETAMVQSDFSKMERYFFRYRTYANQRFYQIDQDLKNACGELRNVGGDLMIAGETL